MKEKANLLQRIFGQPDSLPEALARKIEHRTGEKIRIFAYCDLHPGFEFRDSWLVATDNYLVHARMEASNQVKNIEMELTHLAEVDRLEIIEGITLNRLNIVARQDNRLLITCFFSRRQMRAIGNLRFVVEQECQRIRSGEDPKDLHQVESPEVKYREAVIQAVREAKGTTLLQERNVFWRLLKYLKPYKKWMILGFAASVLMTVLGLLPPYLTRILVDDVLQPAETGQISKPEFWIWVIVGSLAFIWTASQVANFFRLRIMATVGEKIATKLRDDLYQHLQKLSLSFYNMRSTGSIISRLTSDTDRLW
ncbi:MAG: ABC transporter ATP-binding protein, partial [Calditrichaeota bacterium]